MQQLVDWKAIDYQQASNQASQHCKKSKTNFFVLYISGWFGYIMLRMCNFSKSNMLFIVFLPPLQTRLVNPSSCRQCDHYCKRYKQSRHLDTKKENSFCTVSFPPLQTWLAGWGHLLNIIRYFDLVNSWLLISQNEVLVRHMTSAIDFSFQRLQRLSTTAVY